MQNPIVEKEPATPVVDKAVDELTNAVQKVVIEKEPEEFPVVGKLPENPAKGKKTYELIAFYGHKRQWGQFSNFYEAEIVVNDKKYPTTEHYFQAGKYAGKDDEYAETIRAASSGAESAALGRDKSKPIRGDWEAIKNEIMYRALVAKFTQHVDLRQVLLSTGDQLLVEHTKNDKCWGDGVDGDTIGDGDNRLGQLLMRVRGEIRAGRYGDPVTPVTRFPAV